MPMIFRAAATLRISGSRSLLCRPCSTLPRIVEPHFHYVAGSLGTFHQTAAQLGVPDYTPEQFAADATGLQIANAVHVEIAPSSPLGEAEYVEGLISAKRTPARGIVAACDLWADDADARLRQLKDRAPHLVGIRYIVDYDGPFGEAPATHVTLSRHFADGTPCQVLGGPGVDFLRHATAAQQFETGYARLAHYGLRFDLQCAPAQLGAAAALIGRHPGVAVVIDHLGKPRLRDDATANAAELATWRSGMRQLAALDHVYVKLSMLGYSVPGWVADAAKEELLASLVRETIDMFGASRCMFSSNWWMNGAMANSDGRDTCDITMKELWQRYHSWVMGRYSEEEVRRLFAGSADEFYSL